MPWELVLFLRRGKSGGEGKKSGGDRRYATFEMSGTDRDTEM